MKHWRFDSLTDAIGDYKPPRTSSINCWPPVFRRHFIYFAVGTNQFTSRDRNSPPRRRTFGRKAVACPFATATPESTFCCEQVPLIRYLSIQFNTQHSREWSGFDLNHVHVLAIYYCCHCQQGIHKATLVEDHG